MGVVVGEDNHTKVVKCHIFQEEHILEEEIHITKIHHTGSTKSPILHQNEEPLM